MARPEDIFQQVEEAKHWLKSNYGKAFKVRPDNVHTFLDGVKVLQEKVGLEVRDAKAWCLAILKLDVPVAFGQEVKFLSRVDKLKLRHKGRPEAPQDPRLAFHHHNQINLGHGGAIAERKADFEEDKPVPMELC